jgi:hypothetical protein
VTSVTAIVIFQVAQRWMNFAIANPARQVFFTVVEREEKYKAKNLIDVVIYRGSDALYGWVFDLLQAAGLKLGGIALCALPVVAGWLMLSAALGRTQERRAATAHGDWPSKPLPIDCNWCCTDRLNSPPESGHQTRRFACPLSADCAYGLAAASKSQIELDQFEPCKTEWKSREERNGSIRDGQVAMRHS